MTCTLRVARHRLDDRTRDIVGKEVAEAVVTGRLDSDKDEAILAGIGAHALNHHLPGEILNALKLFSATGAHALVLSNLPTQDFPPSPLSGFADEAELAVTNALHFGLIQLLDITPFAVDYENNGKLIRNVVPNPSAAGTTSSWGADSEFFWHTDNPQLPFGEPGSDPRSYVPRYLTFFSVRNDEQVPTEILSVEDAVARLDEQTRHRLRSADYEFGSPASNDEDLVLAGSSVLELNVDGHRVRYDRGVTSGQTPEAVTSLDVWVDALNDAPALRLVLQPGEFLIFDNYRLLHRRKAFTPASAESARWLRRCYAS